MLIKNRNTLIFSLLSIFLITSCTPRFVQIRQAEILYNKGQTLALRGQAAEAMLKFEESLALAMEAGFKAGVAHNLNEMAIIHTSRGEYVMAKEALARAVEIYKEANMEPEVSKSLNNIAMIYVSEGNPEEALARYEELLKWDRKTNNNLGVAITLNNMGILYEHHLEKREEAQMRYSEALKILKKLGNKSYIRSVEKNMRH